MSVLKLSKPVAQPKPASSKGQRTRRHQSRMAKWRDAVWRRWGLGSAAICAKCSRVVWRTSIPMGAPDHIKPRSTSPELKYDPMNGQILCVVCHARKHGEK